ncbi:DUF2127 domain-containing protein [Pseudoxanthomonas putridarboris]|uniref:DUF2127 domain-containing protein n=1 Tax=Pseudoxanthomonas putridarboris TaxID=752605 RepID=A0ABU9J2B8_9GAMM
MDQATYNPDPKAHPGLHLIALFEGVKGVLALAIAAGLVAVGPQRLRDAVHDLVARFLPRAEPGAMTQFLDRINPESVHIAAAVIVLYALMRLLEAWGLWRARAWASWLGCIGSAAYLPLDLYALYHHPGWHTWALLIVNIAIVLALWRDIVRRRGI